MENVIMEMTENEKSNFGGMDYETDFVRYDGLGRN